MPAKVRVRSPQSWYVPVTDPETGKGRDIPCGIFGDATPERVASMKELVLAVEASTRARKAPGRPHKVTEPVPCPVCAVLLPALNAGGGTPLRLPGIAPGCPKEPPKDVVPRYLVWAKANRGKTTFVNHDCVLRRMLKELGGDSWEPWVKRYWSWWNGLCCIERCRGGRRVSDKPIDPKSKQVHISAYGSFRAWCATEGIHVPDPEGDRPTTCPTQRRRAGKTGNRTKGEAYSPDQCRSLLKALKTIEAPADFVLAVYAGMFGGINPEDARTALGIVRPHDPIPYSYAWEGGAHGLVFYKSERAKTGEAYNVPLAPALAAQLRPFREGNSIRLRAPARSIGTWRLYYEQLEQAAGIASIRGQNMKRLRSSFQAILENDLRVPSGIRTRLMGHVAATDQGAKAAYSRAHDEETAAAILELQEFLVSAPASVAERVSV